MGSTRPRRERTPTWPQLRARWQWRFEIDESAGEGQRQDLHGAGEQLHLAGDRPEPVGLQSQHAGVAAWKRREHLHSLAGVLQSGRYPTSLVFEELESESGSLPEHLVITAAGPQFGDDCVDLGRQ